MSSSSKDLFRFPQVYVVEASAGSGKTYALAKRYVSLLLGSASAPADALLRNILAITFSNKATREMKERIFDFLKRIALDKFPDPSQKKEIFSGFLADEASARAAAFAALDAIIGRYNYFQVQTIDSFINAILSGCAFKLNLSASFKIKTDARPFLAYSLDALIDRAAGEREVAVLLKTFLRQYLLMEHRGGWFPKRDILEAVTALHDEMNRYGGDFVGVDVSLREIRALRKAVLSRIRQVEKLAVPETHALFRKSLGSFLEGGDEYFDLGSLSDYFRREEFPVTKGGRVPARLAGLWKRLREDLRTLAELESAAVFSPYITILAAVMRDFARLSSKEDVLFLEELNRRARLLFEEGAVTVPELYYRLAARLRHFLIDEFQDTSRLQWRNLFLMVEEALATGGSLFYVGDKKQAIYRFRGGEVALFDGVKERFGPFNLIEETLQRNYRSDKAIVDFANRVFAPDNLRRFIEEHGTAAKKGVRFGAEEIEEVLGVFRSGLQTPRPGRQEGYVTVRRVEARTQEERDAAVRPLLVDVVGELAGRFSYGGVALLTRHNDDVALLTEWLLAAGMPVESEKTLNIKNNALIKELVSLLRFLNSPIDDLAFASFILGDILAKAAGLPKEEFHAFVFEARRKERRRRGVYLYRQFRRAFPQVWESHLEGFFRGVGFVPLYELVTSILGRFGCPERFPEAQGFFMRFLELIKEREEDAPSLPLFLDYFEDAPEEDLYVAAASADAVRILTIHKAKGLGFPAVVVPFFEIAVKVDTDISYPVEEGIVRRRVSEKYRAFSPKLEALYREEYRKVFLDELNSAYVALTRPARELHLFIPGRAGRANNLADMLIPADAQEVGSKAAGPQEPPRDAFLRAQVPASRYEDWVGRLQEEFDPAPLLARRQSVQAGEVFHAILCGVGDLSGRDPARIVEDAVTAVRRKFPWIEDFGPFADVVRRLVVQKPLEPFFFLSAGHAVYQEKEVVDAQGRTRRIDRLVVGPAQAAVLDYKSSREDAAAHRAQVAEYMRSIAQVYPGREVRGFLVYLDDMGLDEVHG